MKKMSGIEPIIAVVILVAVTLVIAIGVIGWLMGWWGGMGQVETLVIHPDSKLYANGTIELHVENKGTAAAVIYKVEVVGVASATKFDGVPIRSPLPLDKTPFSLLILARRSRLAQAML